MANWILQLIINFVLTQLASFGTNINWGDIKTKANTFVNSFLPSFLQPSVDGLVDGAVDAIAAALADSADIGLIISDLAAQNWAKALSDLEAMLEKLATPTASAVAAATKLVS